MTSHQFARKLLEAEELEIIITRVVEYSDDEENNTASPMLSKVEGVDPQGEPINAWMITYGSDHLEAAKKLP